MIFYFTGTGNSKWVAQLLGTRLNESLVSINDLLKSGAPSFEFEVSPQERLGLVFPIYSWGLPSPVVMFIERLDLKNGTGRKFFSVATCGDNAGLTDKMLKKLLNEKGMGLSSIHTVQMPNCYILMKGFDVDPEDLAKRKIAAAPDRVDRIIKAILDERQDKSLYTRGSLSWVKSRLIYPPFIKNTKYTKYFTTEKCTHCGLCAKLCPMNNITLSDGKPVWSDKCVQCHACINRCPSRAIESGKVTQNKGRYHFPGDSK